MTSKVRNKLATSLLAVMLCSGAAFAQGTAVYNYLAGQQRDVIGILDLGSGTGSVETRFWAVGDPAAHNSGLLQTALQLLPLAPDAYAVNSDWTASGVSGGPPPFSERTAFLYSVENGGTGQYLLMSVAHDPILGGYAFDNITNGNVEGAPNEMTPLPVPSVNIVQVRSGGGRASVIVMWTPVTGLKGFYDVPPTENLLTGAAVRYSFGTPELPPSHRTEDWKVAEGGFVSFGPFGTDPGVAEVSVPFPPTGTQLYLALSLLCEGAQPESGARAFTETSFLGTPATARIDVTEPVFGFVGATSSLRGGLRVTWTMRNESAVSHYVVYGSATSQGPFVELSGEVPTHGNLPGPYLFTTVARSARYVRVEAVPARGPSVFSSVVLASR